MEELKLTEEQKQIIMDNWDVIMAMKPKPKPKAYSGMLKSYLYRFQYKKYSLPPDGSYVTHKQYEQTIYNVRNMFTHVIGPGESFVGWLENDGSYKWYQKSGCIGDSFSNEWALENLTDIKEDQDSNINPPNDNCETIDCTCYCLIGGSCICKK